MWLAEGSYEDYNLLEGCGGWCPVCDRQAERYECRVAKRGGILDGVKAGLREPGWVAASAAFYAAALEDPTAARTGYGPDWESVWLNQFAPMKDVLGQGDPPDARWPQWRTSDVRALARGIYRDQAFDLLPILADALQDAGCDDDMVLSHCREGKNHVRGCWVVDLAMGLG